MKRHFLTNKRKTSTLIKLLSALAIPASIAYSGYAIENQPEVSVQKEQTTARLVSYVEAKPSTHQVVLESHGEAKSKFSLELKTQVGGVVETISDAFQNGQILKQGEILLNIDPTNYEQALAASEYTLSQARVGLLQEQQQVSRAKVEWEQSGVNAKPLSPLLLREPQLQAAQDNLKQARASVKKAMQDLEKTKIQSPFNATVVSRLVSPGQYLSPGEQVAQLYGIDQIEISVSLPITDWQYLPSEQSKVKGQAVEMKDRYGNSWQGHIDRFEHHINSQSRQRNLVISVEQTANAQNLLLPGTFLTVKIPGLAFNNLLELPASSLTASGYIWHVNSANELDRFKADTVFKHAGKLYVKPPKSDVNNDGSNTVVKVLFNPSKSFVVGQKVSPTSVAMETL